MAPPWWGTGLYHVPMCVSPRRHANGLLSALCRSPLLMGLRPARLPAPHLCKQGPCLEVCPSSTQSLRPLSFPPLSRCRKAFTIQHPGTGQDLIASVIRNGCPGAREGEDRQELGWGTVSILEDFGTIPRFLYSVKIDSTLGYNVCLLLGKVGGRNPGVPPAHHHNAFQPVP